ALGQCPRTVPAAGRMTRDAEPEAGRDRLIGSSGGLAVMPPIIYTMKNLRKLTPQGKEILKGIWLSFFHGAKIGVLGHNGAGKSALLRIMAGLDKDWDGEAFLAEGMTAGLLPQEPTLPDGSTVQQVVEEAVAAKKSVLARYEELAASYSDETADEFARLQDRIDAENLWELDRQLEIAMDA